MSDNYPEFDEIKEEAKEAINAAEDKAEKIGEAAAENIPEQTFTPPAEPATHSYTYGRDSAPARPGPENYGQQPPRRPAEAPYGYQQDRQQYAGYGRQYEQPYGAGYAQYGAPHAGYYQAPETKVKKEKKKKEKRGFTKGAALALALLTVLLSCAAGALGSYLYGKYVKSSGVDDVVMYRSVETKTDTSDMSVAAVANKVSDSVVEITTEYVTTGYFSFGQYVTQGAGSGVIVSDDGYIVTNNHVISDTENGNKLASKISVRLRNGEEYAAKVIGRDADADIAVIKIEANGLTAAVWGDSDSLTVGEQIVVVGNPLGELGGTVTTGIVSASDREIKIDDTKMSLIQTDAAVNPGNSGGGMFNAKGELVGIVNAKSSGTGIEGLGFAIPSNDANDVAKQLLEFGYVKGKVYLGISFYEASMGGWFTDSSSGVLYVYSCEEGYNDDVLQYGDQVVAVDGTAVATKADVKAILQDHEVGDTLTFTILRQGKTKDVTVTCYEYKPGKDDISFGN